MRYITAVLLIALAASVSAQTAEIDSLKAEAKALNHRIQKAMAKEVHRVTTLDAALVTVGYVVQADTTDGDYIQIVIPDSLQREAVLTLREAGKHGIRFIKTSDPNVIRIHKNRLPRAVKAIKTTLSEDEAFPAPTR